MIIESRDVSAKNDRGGSVPLKFFCVQSFSCVQMVCLPLPHVHTKAFEKPGYSDLANVFVNEISGLPPRLLAINEADIQTVAYQ